MKSQWQPFEEPLRQTLFRTVMIALVVGGVIAVLSRKWSSWPLDALLVLWPSFGGHWVEVWFLNWLRPRLSVVRLVQVAARVGAWFVGGTALAFGMDLTAAALAGFRPARWPAWWIGGFAFIGVELLAHLALQLRGRPSFYNGCG
jgi:hypothetical protein